MQVTLLETFSELWKSLGLSKRIVLATSWKQYAILLGQVKNPMLESDRGLGYRPGRLTSTTAARRDSGDTTT